LKKKKFSIAVLLFLALLAVSVFADVDDFEDGDYTNGPTWTRVNADGGAAAVSSAGSIFGDYGVRFTTDGANDEKNNDLQNLDGDGNGFFYSWVRTSNVAGLSFIELDTAGSWVALFKISGGKFSIAAGGAEVDFTEIPVNNVNYRIMFDYNGGATIDAFLFDYQNEVLEYHLNIPCQQDTGTIEGVRIATRDTTVGAFTTDFDGVTYDYESVDYNPIVNPIIVTPVLQESFNYTGVDLNFYYPSDCGSIDANVVNFAPGQDFNVLWSGQLHDQNNQFATVFFFPQNGQQTLRVNADCNHVLRTTDINVSFNLFDFNISTSGFTEYDGNNYLRNLNYDVNYKCGALGLSLDVNINLDDVVVDRQTVDCNNASNRFFGNYTPATEGFQNFKFVFDATVVPDNNILFDDNFFVDLNAPQVLIFDVNNSHGFFSADDATTWVICADLISPVLNYYITQNDVNIFDEQHDQNSLQTVDIDLNNGFNDFNYTCIDVAGNLATDSNDLTIYSKHYFLVDEDDRNVFDTGNCTRLIAFAIDSNFVYDFITEGTNDVYYFSPVGEAVRFEFIYDNAGVDVQVDREFDVTLLSDLNVNVCAAKLQAFYQQVFLATSERDVIVINDFADCYLTASRTTYAYSNIFSLATYTIDKPYYLYTSVNDVKVLLALLDGARATEINLDMLIYAAAELDLRVVSDELSIASLDENTFVIYFEAASNSLDSVDLAVYDGSTVIWSYTENVTPLQFTVFFNHAVVDINADLMSVVLTKHFSDGSTEQITEYFTPQTATGLLHPALAVIFAVLLLVMGLSFVTRGIAFGWFGLIICGIALAILAFAVPVWYVRFFQAIVVIVMIFIALGFRAETSKVI